MKRREFSRAIRVEVVKRACAKRLDGKPSCERCGAVGGGLEIHHKDMDAMEVDKTHKLTADDGELLCAACHDPITSEQRKTLAKAQAREASHLGVAAAPAHPIKSRGFAKAERAPKGGREAAAGAPEIARRFR